MKSDILASNLAALRNRYPHLAQQIEHLPTGEVLKVDTADSGEPTALLRLPDGTEKRLHSRRDPRREVARWAQGMAVKPSETVALFGIGLGYPVEEFLRTHQENLGGLWCFESSLEVFRALLSLKDWRIYIEEPLVHFFVGIDQDSLRMELTSHFQKAMVDGVEIVEYPPSLQLDPDWYRERQGNVRDLIRQWTAEMMSVFSRGRLFLNNIQENFKALLDPDHFLLRDIGEVFRSRPAILVSAGPSLDKNAARLQEAKGKIPIVAVDTALRILARHGVVPDFVVSIDALGMSKKHFEGLEGLEKIPLLYDLETTPDVSSSYPGRKYLVGNTKPQLYRWIEEVTGPLEGLTKGLTVAQAAFQVLARYGAAPIILVGQDLSFQREGGKTHATGAAFQGRYEPSAERGAGRWEDPLNPKGLEDIAVLEVAANDGGMVPTTHALYSYLRRLEEDIARTGAIVINATEGGALIRGTKVATLEEAFSEAGLAELSPQIWERTAGETIGERYGEGLEAIRQTMVSLLEKGLVICEDGFKRSDKAWRDLGWKSYTDQEALALLDQARKPFHQIKQSPQTLMLIDQAVQRALYMLHKGDLGDPQDRTLKEYRIIAERFRTFYADAVETIKDGLARLRPEGKD